jgi:predicted oxidoreductase
MDRVKITDKLDFSRIVYGMWRLADDTNTAPAHVQAKIEACLAQGITTFDQADIYGGYTAEEVLGDALKTAPQLRDQMQIVTKCDIVAPAGRHENAPLKYYDTTAAYLNTSVDMSLKLMAIEHIDLLLVHRPDPLMDHLETGRALDALVQSGKVGSVGVSNFKPWDWDLLQSGMTNKLVTNQIEISLGAHAPLTNGEVAFHQQHNHPIMAWSPLGGGTLMSETGELGQAMDAVAKEHNVSRAEIAVAWLLAHPANIMPVMGTNNLDRIKQLGAASQITMDRVTWYKLYTAALGREVA